MYPDHFATVDQFVVKALRLVPGLPEANALVKMNPEGFCQTNGQLSELSTKRQRLGSKRQEPAD
jgi:hypothetical protein